LDGRSPPGYSLDLMITGRPAAIPAGAGVVLEGVLAMPPETPAGVVVCHPHPLYGGDMDNPVVLAAAAACLEAGLATLRFNFRGVGGSGGAWDDGRGEQDDVRAALAWLRERLAPRSWLALAGYSFGAAMAAAVAGAGERLAGLALIAPPLAVRAWQPRTPSGLDGPWLIVAGSADTYCPAEALAVLGSALPAATVTVIDGADHFFVTGMPHLRAALSAWAGTLARRTSAAGDRASPCRPTG
jgi:alpha/beta superfamily hydrolase